MATELQGFPQEPVYIAWGGRRLAVQDQPDMPSELGSRQEPRLREEAWLEMAGVGGEARLLEGRR